MSKQKASNDLRKIPNVGKQTEHDLLAMGYTSIESLRGKRAEELYAEECALRNRQIDRCQLYLFRAVEYFVNTPDPDPQKCKWWYWKDRHTDVSPCGVICAGCNLFPTKCNGCKTIKGEVFWLQYTGEKCCAVYDCCININRKKHCGECKDLPCTRFKKDPTISDEENLENLRTMLDNLKNATDSG